ncbi:hypothetical protein [Maledivibacter halophilus]|uniref:Uncharacterized protein n=1 Tax=Maledivibacter halophilus TaxID=36842 RepID=A0A1T5LNM4_9FIRM|nr:hypothetical protein [Maledivibacter halophilus]SKC77576.1 hypothetical protein SAMN02194393_03153 [Maledivibacter halophilus]
MILYLSSKENINVLDFINDEEEVILKKYVGEYDLMSFLSKSIQRLGHIEIIVIDLSCIANSDEEIINSIKIFRKCNPSRVVFYMDKINESLVHELIGLGIFDIITEQEVTALKEEIKMSLFEGMSESYVKKKFGLLCDEAESISFDFKEKQIPIGVVGTQNRVGTTTIAMEFAAYLNSIGANVSYVEANESGHLQLIAEHYKMKKIDDGYRYKGIAFEGINSSNDTAFDFIIYDLGVLDNRTMKGFLNCNIRVLCAGNKPHETFYLYEVKEKLVDIKYSTIINYLHELNNEQCDYYYTKSTVDVINRLYNDEIYCSIMKEYFDEIF